MLEDLGENREGNRCTVPGLEKSGWQAIECYEKDQPGALDHQIH